MTIRQRVMKALYPVMIKLTQLTGRNNKVLYNKEMTAPVTSIYDLSVTMNNKNELSLSQFQGRKLLLVNTASDCGYTGQYAELQELYEKFQDRLVVIGFPANDFREQEKGDDAAIGQFCQINYGVSFPLASKSNVVKSPDQHPVYRWLTHAAANGWNNHEPVWNFSKYLVNEKGVLTHYFDPSVVPNSEIIQNAVRQ